MLDKLLDYIPWILCGVLLGIINYNSMVNICST